MYYSHQFFAKKPAQAPKSDAGSFAADAGETNGYGHPQNIAGELSTTDNSPITGTASSQSDLASDDDKLQYHSTISHTKTSPAASLEILSRGF